MELHKLDELIPGLGYEPSNYDLKRLYDQFLNDFVNAPLEVNGLKVKVILKNARVSDYEDYPETFVHLITRKSKSGHRVFDRHRANRIHWIRCILENQDEDEILFFQFREGSGRIRDYFWYEEGDFLVIMEKITPDYLIITSFFIDDEKNRRFYRTRYEARIGK